MSQLIDIHFHDYSSASTPRNKVCVCCLSKDVPLVRIQNCKHNSLFENMVKYKIKETDLHICQQCHKMAAKFELFKQQVIKNISTLTEKAVNVKPCIQNNLKRSNIELNWTVDSQPIEFEIKEEPPVPTNREPEIESETEIKMEYDDDFEADIPLAQIIKPGQLTYQEAYIPLAQIIKPGQIKKNKIKKEQKLEIKNKRPKPQTQYGGVSKIVVITEDEMLKEREEERKKKSYLKLPHKCEDCITAFDSEQAFIEHIKTRHGEKENGFTCKICKSVLSTKTSYEEHTNRHYKRYECVVCGKRYSYVYTLLGHYNAFHGKVDLKFSCKLCDFVTESHRIYRYHKERHRTSRVACDECGRTFVNNGGLRTHKHNIHGKETRVYGCGLCGKRYRARSGLDAHTCSAHSPPPSHTVYCAPCNTHFKTSYCLKQHLKYHSSHVNDDDYKFRCEECDAKFLAAAPLRHHIEWIHRNSGKYQCKSCSKTFKTPRTLKRHMDFVHEKKRPPRNKICDHCGRGFTSLPILQSHIRTHTGERPLQCPHCPATFAHSAARYTHIRLLHTARKTK